MPKMVEVDEEQVRQDAKLRETVAKMLSDPKAKRLVQQAHKLVDPNAVTPDLDREEAIKEPVGKLEEQLKALQKSIDDDKSERDRKVKLDAMERSIESGIDALRRQGWQKEGIEAVRKLMEDKGITDPEIAASYIEKTMPPSTPARPSGVGAWNFTELPPDDNTDIKKLIETKGQSEQLADSMANKALAEIRGQVR